MTDKHAKMGRPRTDFGRDQVRLLRREMLYDGFFRLEKAVVSHRLFGGGDSGEIDREVFLRRPAVAVLPYDPREDCIVLVQQIRVPIFIEGGNPWSVEVVAGLIEDGETAESVAHRELLEEAGCTALDLVPINRFFPSPGGCTETVEMFCARIDSAGIGGIHGVDVEGEDIFCFRIRFEEALALADSGRITNGITLLALNWLWRKRDELGQRWG